MSNAPEMAPEESPLPVSPTGAATMGNTGNTATLPWMVVGSIFACGVLIVLASLVLRSTPIPCSNLPILRLFFALGCACTTAFLGGYAAYRGNIPKVGAVSFGGGAAVLLVLILTGDKLLPSTCTDPIQVVWGTVVGLTEHDSVWSTRVTDVDTYERNSVPDTHGLREFEWIIRFTTHPLPVRFQFQRLIKKAIAVDPLQFPSAEHIGKPAAPDVISIDRYFTLPHGQPPLILDYQQPTENEPIGKLYKREEEKRAIEIPLESTPQPDAGNPKKAALLFGVQDVYAAEPQDPRVAQTASPKGSPCSSNTSTQDRERFLDQLGGSNLADQVAAREQLVQGGPPCLAFISDALKQPSSTLKRQRGVLIGNLTTAIEIMAKKGIPVPGTIWGEVGEWQYKLSEFGKAAEYFQHIDQETFDADPSLLFYDGYSKMKLNRPDDALARYNQYRAKAPQEAESSGSFHGNLGIVYFTLGKNAAESGNDATALKLYSNAEGELQQGISIITKVYAGSPAAHTLFLELEAARLAAENTKLRQQVK
jgi:hypothetical protein